MAGRAIRDHPGRHRGGHLSTRMEPAAPTPGPALRGASRRPVRGGTGDDAARAPLTPRDADPSVVGCPHWAAPGPHGGRRAPAVDGRAGGSAVRRVGPPDPPPGARVYGPPR